MPNIEENYTDSQLEIISLGSVAATFDTGSGDYIRLSLFDENGNYTNRQFFSNQNISGLGVPQIEIYTDASNNIHVKPNEILDINAVP
ncbi:hypothetical protein CL614_08895, partial [archaeon]|nr:hypothetical protein [archaeon]